MLGAKKFENNNDDDDEQCDKCSGRRDHLPSPGDNYSIQCFGELKVNYSVAMWRKMTTILLVVVMMMKFFLVIMLLLLVMMMMTGLHNLLSPVIIDQRTWIKIREHGKDVKHGAVHQFYNSNVLRVPERKPRTVFFLQPLYLRYFGKGENKNWYFG